MEGGLAIYLNSGGIANLGIPQFSWGGDEFECTKYELCDNHKPNDTQKLTCTIFPMSLILSL